jgi:hypothetical protein
LTTRDRRDATRQLTKVKRHIGYLVDYS